MPRCFCSQLNGMEYVTLSGSESHHLIVVLRASKGTEVELIDGQGTAAKGHVESPDRGAARVSIVTSHTEIQNFRLSLIQATLTNNNLDFVIREACAIGVSSICILQADRSESKIMDRLETKLVHWNKLLIEACKQSGNLFLPKLSFAEDVGKLQIDENASKFFGHMGATKYLIHELSSIGRMRDIAIAIGPEGDFSEREKDFFLLKISLDAGCRMVCFARKRQQSMR